MTAPDTRLWTPTELAARWGVPADTIRAWVRRGHLHGAQFGSRVYVPSAEVARIETGRDDRATA